MKNRLSFIIAIILLITLNSCDGPNSNNTASNTTSSYASSNYINRTHEKISDTNYLTTEQMCEDLEQLRNYLKKIHYDTMNGLTDSAERAFEIAFHKVSTSLSINSFQGVVSNILSTFHDIHTFTRIESSEALPLELKYSEKELLIAVSQLSDIRSADSILSVNGYNVNYLYSLFEGLYSYENKHYLDLMFARKIVSKNILCAIGVANDTDSYAKVLFKSTNSNSTKEIKVFYKETKPDSYEAYCYDIEEETGVCIFKWKIFENTKHFDEFLRIMFADINNSQITNLIIDVRGCVGGNYNAFETFLKYIGNVNFHYADIYMRLSDISKEKWNITSNENIKKMSDAISISEEPSFKGNIYCLTSSDTLSLGSNSSEILRRCNIATIIGEPTGSSLNSYANPVSIVLDNSKIGVQISTAKYNYFDLPDNSDAVYPDIWIRTPLLNKMDYSESDFVYQRALEYIRTRSQ